MASEWLPPPTHRVVCWLEGGRRCCSCDRRGRARAGHRTASLPFPSPPTGPAAPGHGVLLQQRERGHRPDSRPSSLKQTYLRLGKTSPNCEEEETKRLLEPAVSPPNKVLNGAEQNYHSLPSARTDEQAMLSSILAKTATNIIDVSAADSQGMEQHEYMDRARQYSTRLAMLSNNLTHWKKLPPLPSLTSQPHQVLASETVPYPDLQQVSRIAAYAFSALSQIRVDAKEELVVQFGIP
ncbi:ragulator complex protein LAMTOR1 isoform X1 [Caretta caretta]|uniref:ragulator complex protein LAMTOR1 isoform X1 n=1 Tax=Caretta caretta TaxID=8467 RepID=UPI003F4B3B38